MEDEQATGYTDPVFRATRGEVECMHEHDASTHYTASVDRSLFPTTDTTTTTTFSDRRRSDRVNLRPRNVVGTRPDNERNNTIGTKRASLTFGFALVVFDDVKKFLKEETRWSRVEIPLVGRCNSYTKDHRVDCVTENGPRAAKPINGARRNSLSSRYLFSIEARLPVPAAPLSLRS